MPWIPKKSRSTGKTYYYNTETKKTSWVKPKEKKQPFMCRETVHEEKKEAVANAYSDMTQNAKAVSRKRTKKIRTYNNVIKREVIRFCIGGSMIKIKVLDLCCGRGGDLGKILSHPTVRRYRGVDISDEAVIEAIRRVKQYNQYAAIVDFECMDAVKEDWATFNPLERDIGTMSRHLHDTRMLNEPYDASKHTFSFINCQYAFHYFCKTKETAKTMLKKIHDSMAVGPSSLCVTLPNSQRIQDAIRGMYKLPTYCKITPSKTWKGKGEFGDPYMFYLEDCVPGVEEYLVPKDTFIELASSCGLKNTFYQNAGAFLETRDECNVDIEKNLDWNVTCLYDIYIFLKKSSS